MTAVLAGWLAEWAEWTDRVVFLGPDPGTGHAQLCWDVLEPTGLLHVHCRDCKYRHGGPRSARQMRDRLHLVVPVAEAADWVVSTMVQDLVYSGLRGSPESRELVGLLAEELVGLLGPDAEWRANGHAAHRAPGLSSWSWSSVTECTFDAALVGIGAGHAVVIVATGED